MDLFGVRGLPFLSRRNYYYEFLHLLPWGLFAGMIEGNAAAIVVKKTFSGGPFLVATASATPIGTLLCSYAWGLLCVGRPKLRLTTTFGTVAAFITATACLTPHTPAGGYLFVAQMACAQAFLAGVVTVRSSLWKHNYPPHARGRIAARLQAVRLLMGVCMLLTASAVFDHDPSLYRFIYPLAAVSALGALVILQRIHVRHEKTDLRALGDSVHRVTLRESLSPRLLFRGMGRILNDDRRYARYLATQMAMGSSVQLVIPVLVIVIGQTVHRYIIAAFLIEMLPKLMMFSSLRRWGRLFDRVGVNRFRVFTGSCAAVGLLFGLIGTYLVAAGHDRSATHSWSSTVAIPAALACFTLRGVLHGLHQGGGTLAWNLGHLHYARRHDAELYMGAHQTLTGVRGLVTPFVGAFLWQQIGWGVWAVAFVLCVLAVVGFHRLAMEDDARKHK